MACHPERSAVRRGGRRAVEGSAVVFLHRSRASFWQESTAAEGISSFQIPSIRTAIVASLISILFLSIPINSQTPSSSSAFRIAGRVVNASTGEPVRRAAVAALGEDDGQIVESAQTDSDGNFSLDHLPPAKYPLTASRRGYRTGFYDEHGDYNSAIVTGPDQDTSHLVFKLMPGAVLHGVVTGDGGDPAENASVILFKRDHGVPHGAGADEIRQSDGATTDDTGAFEFSNLSAGEYYVAVVTQPWYAMHAPARRNPASGDSPLDVAYPVTFFDSTTEEASATPIQIEAGARQEADISLHAVPALRLQVTAPRKGAEFVQPELRTMVFGTQVSGQSGENFSPVGPGMVEFNGLAPGKYELVQGDPPRISELDATSSQSVDPNAGVPALTISGILRSAAGALIPENVNVTLEPVGGRNQTTMQMNAHNGEFQFDGVTAGVWALSAQAQGNVLPVVALSAGGSMTAGNQITVKDRSVAVAVIVSPSLSRVQGFARADGKGVSGAMIVLVPRQPSAYRALVRRDQSDSDGSFNLRDVPAGQYTVIAIQDGWNLDWSDRATMARYLPGGVPVTISGQAGGIVRLPDSVPVQ